MMKKTTKPAMPIAKITPIIFSQNPAPNSSTALLSVCRAVSSELPCYGIVRGRRRTVFIRPG
jgi:hypothetical protein